LDVNEALPPVGAQGDASPGQGNGIDSTVGVAAGTCTKPVKPVSMTASTKVDGPEVEATAIVTKGVLSLLTDPRIDAMEAARPVRDPITDTYQMEGTNVVSS
jgi:hypothetical protein